MSNTVDWLSLLDQAKEGGISLDRSPVPAARYPFKVVKAEAAVSSNNNTMYKITAEIQAGPHAGRYIFENITLTENTAKWFFIKMNALGATENFFRTANPSPEQIASQIQGAFFEGEVDIEPPRGNYEPRNRIQKWFPVTVPAGVAPVASPQAYSTPPQGYAPPAPAAPVAAPTAPVAPPAPAQQPAVDPWSNPAQAAPAPAPAPQAPWETSAPPVQHNGNTPF